MLQQTAVHFLSTSTMDANDSYNHTIDDDDDGDHEDFNEEAAISPSVRFWILLIPCIASIICSILVLCILLGRKEYRRSFNHRVVIVQLIGGLIFLLTHLPIYLNYLRLGYVWPSTPAMCQFWWFVGDGFADTMTILMAWAAFERHILVFHDQWFLIKKKRFFAHYLPTTLIILHCPLYYLIVMLFPPCENHYQYDEYTCGLSCLYQNRILIMYDTLINDILATLLVAIFSISLIVRVTQHGRARFQHRIQWRRHRKTIIILVSISLIYLVFNLPMMILQLAYFCGLPHETLEHLEPYFEFLNYFIFIIYPFICLITTSSKFCKRRRNMVGPVQMTVTQRSKMQRPTK